ncbi:MAG: hypothetical protein K2L89_05275 [Muribaculaceae bacterium]|nr:hypothetical protein [Muribaculaceae bacterium]
MYKPQLIVMLTFNDMTIENAEDIFESCKHLPVTYWGFKEKPIGRERMKNLFSRMKQCGKKTVLEVVEYDREGALAGLKAAVECGVDMLMGTKFYPEVATECNRAGIRYLPFIGQIEGRPSILKGEIKILAEEAVSVMEQGAYGVDLLAYRYPGEVENLIEEINKVCDGKLCVAGSIDSYNRLDVVKRLKPEWFTIGSAFFNHKFGDDIPTQIDAVLKYLR